MTVLETDGEGVMGIDTMGRVTVTAKVENLGDLVLVERGLLPADQVRSIEINVADGLGPYGFGRAPLGLRLLLDVFALVQDQSGEVVPCIIDLRDEARDQFLSLDLPLREPPERFVLQSTQLDLE